MEKAISKVFDSFLGHASHLLVEFLRVYVLLKFRALVTELIVEVNEQETVRRNAKESR